MLGSHFFVSHYFSSQTSHVIFIVTICQRLFSNVCFSLNPWTTPKVTRWKWLTTKIQVSSFELFDFLSINTILLDSGSKNNVSYSSTVVLRIMFLVVILDFLSIIM